MVERIRQLLEIRQLTPTQFADAIGVARPIVSHILSGRNKPSLEVVQRILTAMPDLSMPWLLNGTGAMQAAVSGASLSPAATPIALIAPETQAPRPALPGVAPYKAREAAAPRTPMAAKVVRESANTLKLPAFKRFTTARPAQAAPTSADTESVEREVAAEKALAPGQAPPASQQAVVAPLPLPSVGSVAATTVAGADAAALLAGSEKAIRRIVIFYRDGSFADFQPE